MEPPQTPSNVQRRQDEQHLTLLSIFYYIYGAFSLVAGCFGVVYLVMAAVIFASPEMVEDDEVPAAVISGIMAVVGGCVLLLALGMGAVIIYAGYSLSQHRNYIFCIVIGALICLNIPIGTVLGVFTIVVLLRPSVKALFEEKISRVRSATLDG
jgi:protein-S-isoprenylcysteine O-methyltransferase Ste14